ncbi:phage holin family protein [Hathewaya limosa]|uniref:Toxin secretion/phage lysis holin n=1 Tax=Hathewaya limosa TaxID=1536 RepID=A0ABU0JUV9_HATLI|nr:phage holin family protein [Hathewaya limosa]MDQ0479903.1 toxin secretion/phage lysis holin [Hathewaya limosa]
MKNVIKTIQMIFASIGGWLGWILGGADGFLYALIAFVVIDYLTGIMASILEQKLSSEVGFRGIFKKILIFVLVGVANIIDSYLIGSGNAIRTTVIFFYISNEGISILENATRIGLPVPDKLKNILEQLKEENRNR